MSDWIEKSDEWLCEVLRGEDLQEKNAAMEVLWERYYQRVKRYASTIVGKDKAEDVTQETFIKVFAYASQESKEKIIKFENFLMRTARNTSVSELRKWQDEISIENDIPLAAVDIPLAVEDLIEEVILNQEKQNLLQRQFINRMLFSKLSDCQRVIWMLRKYVHFRSRAVSKLMGKSIGTIDTTVYSAKEKLKNYLSSEDYRRDHDSLEKGWAEDDWYYGRYAKYYARTLRRHLFVERFINPLTPQFSPDELKPLGLTLEELQNNYMVSIVSPEWLIEERPDTRRIYLLLTRRCDWIIYEKMAEQWYSTAHETRGIPPMEYLWEYVPEEFLLTVDTDGDNIVLTPQSFLELVPDLPEEDAVTYTPKPAQVSFIMHSKSNEYFPSGPQVAVGMLRGDLLGEAPTLVSGWWSFRELAQLEQRLLEERVDREAVLRAWLQAKSNKTSPGRAQRGWPPHLSEVIDTYRWWWPLGQLRPRLPKVVSHEKWEALWELLNEVFDD